MELYIVGLLLLTFGCLATVQQNQWGQAFWQQVAHSSGQPAWPANNPARLQPRPVQRPAMVQMPTKVQDQVVQSKQTFPEHLTWRFPENPVKEELPAITEHRPPPVAANSVAVQCGESAARVEVKQDLFGIGQLIDPADLTLGSCAVTGEDASVQVLFFDTELHGCGSTMMMTEEILTYVFTLHYTPKPLGSSHIVRTREVMVAVECHYQRKQDVSSNGVKPTWNPFASTKVAEELLYFSLKLMTDNWQSERSNSDYVLGDDMKFEASVLQFYHVPLRVFVDSCMATVIPNTNTVPRYAFIENRGCLVDAKLTGSTSQFMPRTLDNKLQFQVEAFKFQQVKTGSLYITCLLKATTVSAPIDDENKACSFSNGWHEASRKANVCGCCETDCGMRNQQNPLSGPGFQWEQETTIGPLNIKEKLTY
ncbi:zona pellucida sperm-binding protein 3 [Esox lucius]|uniref:Zona pellucida sperm-binding protein 3 n=1 Tax=Esox lucius TaxID=8010 RepID=A0A3P9A8M3_ESOLU|nr:zona pellucida sperm-binding protein 3 [Esox lucius]